LLHQTHPVIHSAMKKLPETKNNNDETYLICTFSKGFPRKHIAVCRKCRRKAKCKPYQDYIQPGLF